MNLLDLMEAGEEQAPQLAPNRPPRKCSCPSYYYPTMVADTRIREDVITLLEQRNFRRLSELGIRFWHAGDKRWYCWTTKLYSDFIATARPFPKCNRSRGERDP